MERAIGIEPTRPDWQPSALPLSYARKLFGSVAPIRTEIDASKGHRPTIERQRSKPNTLAGAASISLANSGIPSMPREAHRLPFHTETFGCPSEIRTPVCCSRGSCPTTERTGSNSNLAPEERFELPIGALTVRCLATWLPWNDKTLALGQGLMKLRLIPGYTTIPCVPAG